MFDVKELISVLALFAFFLLMVMLVVILADFMRSIGKLLAIIPLAIVFLEYYHSKP